MDQNHKKRNKSREKTVILEENVRLTNELKKLTASKSKMTLDDLLSKQRSPNNKTGLGYASYAYRKSNNNNKEMPAQAKNKKVFGGNKTPKGNVLKRITRDQITTMFCLKISMVIFMLNMMAPMMDMLLGQFGSQRPLLLT